MKKRSKRRYFLKFFVLFVSLGLLLFGPIIRQLITQYFNRVAAQKAYEEGEQLRNQLTAESLRKAIEKYREAHQFWRAADDRFGEAGALHQIGFVHQRLGERREALDYFNQALRITLEVTQNNPTVGLATLFHSTGSMYRDFGDMEKAIDYFNRALQIQRAVVGPD